MNHYLHALTFSRSEARGIPNLLFAPPKPTTDKTPDPSIYNSGHGDSRGYYLDGAYIAAPVLGPNLPLADPTTTTSRGADAEGIWGTETSSKDAYTSSLLSLFRKQRAELNSIPASKAAQTLPPKTPISLPKYTPHAYKQFQDLIRSRDPTPPHLAALSKPTVLHMLDLSTQLFKRRRNVDRRYSAWVWGLLCRLGDAGTLDSDAVSVLRELGKKAVWVGIGFMDSDAAKSTEGYADSSEYHGEDEQDLQLNDEQANREVEHAPTRADGENIIVDQDSMNEYQRDRRRNTSSPEHSESDLHELPDAVRSFNRRRNTSSPGPPDERTKEMTSERALNKTTAPQESIDDIAVAKARLLRRLNSQHAVPGHGKKVEAKNDGYHSDEEEHCPNSNTRATIDMIIAIVGELYGQRDLLEFRDSWEGEMGLWG